MEVFGTHHINSSSSSSWLGLQTRRTHSQCDGERTDGEWTIYSDEGSMHTVNEKRILHRYGMAWEGRRTHHRSSLPMCCRVRMQFQWFHVLDLHMFTNTFSWQVCHVLMKTRLSSGGFRLSETCHHVAAMLFHVADAARTTAAKTCTDLPCAWIVPPQGGRTHLLLLSAFHCI